MHRGLRHASRACIGGRGFRTSTKAHQQQQQPSAGPPPGPDPDAKSASSRAITMMEQAMPRILAVAATAIVSTAVVVYQTEKNTMKAQNRFLRGKLEIAEMDRNMDQIREEMATLKISSKQGAMEEQEAERVSAELSRETGEESRVVAELKRVAGSLEQMMGEQKRLSAEVKRVRADSARQERERARDAIIIEQVRKSTEQLEASEQAESIRRLTEQRRNADEQQRVKAEMMRMNQAGEAMQQAQAEQSSVVQTELRPVVEEQRRVRQLITTLDVEGKRVSSLLEETFTQQQALQQRMAAADAAWKAKEHVHKIATKRTTDALVRIGETQVVTETRLQNIEKATEGQMATMKVAIKRTAETTQTGLEEQERLNKIVLELQEKEQVNRAAFTGALAHTKAELAQMSSAQKRLSADLEQANLYWQEQGQEHERVVTDLHAALGRACVEHKVMAQRTDTAQNALLSLQSAQGTALQSMQTLDKGEKERRLDKLLRHFMILEKRKRQIESSDLLPEDTKPENSAVAANYNMLFGVNSESKIPSGPFHLQEEEEQPPHRNWKSRVEVSTPHI